MGKPPAGKSSPSPPQPPEEQLLEPGLDFLKVNEEQEGAVSEAVEASVAGVLDFIRGRQLEEIVHDHTAEVVTGDITRIYATVDIRYDPGHDESLPPPTRGQLVQEDHDSTTTVTNGDPHPITQQQPQPPQQRRHQFFQKAGTLLPSPEPQPAPIDRWARGWVVARSTSARDWNRNRHGGSTDDWSEEGRSLRSARSLGTGLNSAHRHGGHTRRRSHHHHHNNNNKEDQTGVPFPLAPEVREDQSLPPGIPVKGRTARKGGRGGGKGGRGGRSRHGNRTGGDVGSGGGGANGSGDGPESSRHQEGSVEDKDGEDDDVDSMVKELGGREWTIDGSGELLIVDRPQGDAMPKTVVSALYNFRDIQDKGGGDPGAAPEGTAGRGGGGGSGSGGKGGDELRSGGGGGGGGKRRSNCSGDSAFSKENTQSSSAPRRASRRRSSRRLAGRRSGSGLFFELEPTLQPNLTNSVDRPGPGVSVSDGDSLKEGPSWPQDPDHMSRSEYRQRQRQQDLADTNTLDGGGEDASTLGFSLGSVQSAPALGGLGLGLNGSSGGGSAGAGAGARGGGGRRAVSGGGGVRGTNITAFENVNPFAGGVRVATSTTPKRATGEGATAAAAATGGDLSPLSASVEGQSGGGRFFSGAGPESSSLGEESDDPHLALVKDPEWGRNVRGSPKEAGYLPKVKQMSRERPLTHERPHTRNPRDPRNVPARENAHASPKSFINNDDDHRKKAGGVGASSVKSCASFPSLPMPLTGWSRDRGGGGGGGTSPGMGGGIDKGRGMITMNKPKEILVEGLLR